MTHNDYDDDINNLKKKMTESFDDTTKISEDMLGIRQRFTKVLTSMLITSNGKNDIYIMGMTPFHRNLRILRVYLTDFFSKKNTTITLDNIKDFLRFYFTNFDPNEKFLIDLDSEYDQDGEIKDPVKEENIIRQSFRNAIFNNFNFGLKHVYKEYTDNFDKFFILRNEIERAKAINDNSLKDTKEQEMRELKDTIKNVMGGSNDAFNEWNDKGNSYQQMTLIKNNLISPLLKNLFKPVRGVNDFDEICEYEDETDETENNNKKDFNKSYDYKALYKNLETDVDSKYKSMFD
jgi:hypothetical protein